MKLMTPAEIDAYSPEHTIAKEPLAQAQKRMQRLGLWDASQQMGRSWPIGCVALEITQRCNLDCTLCYLSEHAEAVHDLPLSEVLRRVEQIHVHYGPSTDVQITGGDPTLRKRDELLAIVAKVRTLGMRPTLMTNGIKATRELLTALAQVGLADVAFHVDTTQNRKGYTSEKALNTIRQDYIERTRGLPLSIMFNTTIHKGNIEEIPTLVAFFKRHADAVRTASFQLQADTGRGVERRRAELVSVENVIKRIKQGAGTQLNFDGFTIGHSGCNRYALCLAANGTLHDVFAHSIPLIQNIQKATLKQLRWDRTQPKKTAIAFGRWLLTHPRYLLACLVWAGKTLWRMKQDLLAARGRVTTLSFLIHNFMDADRLEHDRIEGCVFKTMTANGPLSMCMHNAKRDSYILRPVTINTSKGIAHWQPLTGQLSKHSQVQRPPLPQKRKHLKGRARLTQAQ